MSKTFSPGFRFSVMDAGVLLVGTLLAAYLFKVNFALSMMVIMVVGHFFLFCNITRMSRIPELIWSGIFIILMSLHLYFQLISLALAFSVACCVTILIVLLELKKPSYHGMFWKQVNPNLQDWFEKRWLKMNGDS